MSGSRVPSGKANSDCTWTATNTADYNLSSTTSTIVAGSTSGSITLTPVNDTTEETSETIILSASVSEVETTGNTSTTITMHDYVLKCNATAYTLSLIHI